MKLDENFSVVRGNILVMLLLPSISLTYRVFAQEEGHKEISQLSTQTKALAFAADKQRFNNFSNTGSSHKFSGSKFVPQSSQSVSSGNYKLNSSSTSNKRNQRFLCTHYQILGHNIERCY